MMFLFTEELFINQSHNYFTNINYELTFLNLMLHNITTIEEELQKPSFLPSNCFYLIETIFRLKKVTQILT